MNKKFYFLFLFVTLLMVCCSDLKQKQKTIPAQTTNETINKDSDYFRRQLEKLLPESEHIALKAIDSIGNFYKDSLHTLSLLKKILYQDIGLTFNSDAQTLDNIYPSKILKNKGSSCLGTSIIALLLAENWEMSLNGVLIPTHFFLRYQDSINFEPNLKGYNHPDSYYMSRYNIDSEHQVYLKNLSFKEVLGVVCYMQANFLQTKNTLSRKNKVNSLKRLQLARHYFPKYPEAIGNSSLLHAQLGNFDSAITLLAELKTISPLDTLVEYNSAIIQRLQKGGI